MKTKIIFSIMLLTFSPVNFLSGKSIQTPDDLNPFYTFWDDYDNDGDLDAVTLYPESIIYRNDGNEFLTSLDIDLPSVHYYGSAAWGDFDNDGDKDLLMNGICICPEFLPVDILNDAQYIAKIFRNDGNDMFTDIAVEFTGGARGMVSIGDYDLDEDIDFVITGMRSVRDYIDSGYSNYETNIYRNDGCMTFVKVKKLIGGNVARWGDYDQDGDLDVLITGISRSSWSDYGFGGTSYSTNLFQNDGNDRFLSVETDFTDTAFKWADFGDMDNDGALDIYFYGQRGVIYINKGLGQFLQAVDTLAGDYGLCRDYDNDGDLDVIGRDLVIYQNNNTTANAIPAIPEALSTIVSNDTVHFSWDPSIDPETQSVSLTYNLQIGISPNRYDVMSSIMTVPESYKRLLLWGNVFQNTSWTVHGLADGTYYWRVQAADNGFAKSGFSTARMFVLDAPPAPPRHLVNIIKVDFIELKWINNSEPDISYYRIHRSMNCDSLNAVLIDSVFHPVSSYLDLSIAPGQTYYYWISAVDTSGQVSRLSKNTGPPEAPYSLSVRSNNMAIKIGWMPSAGNIGRHRIYRNNNSDSLSAALIDSIDVPISTYEDFNVTDGEVYFYWIEAVDTLNNRSQLSKTMGPVLFDALPKPPQNLAGTYKNESIILNWSANPEHDILLYKIYRSTSDDSANAVVINYVYHPEIDYLDMEIKEGKSYCYWISAVDNSDNNSHLSQGVGPFMKSFRIHPNYPNPFNQSTTLTFDLPAKGKMSIHVYNINGQFVEEILDQDMRSGNHKIPWQFRNQSSGVYLLHFKYNNIQKCKKCLYLK
ncbi:MAG: FG-GAP-like repeat-containing protein [candidate division KSB1 bacterium]|jgi:fibronectin type 3 domain-containing protein|nr:FG-GAP-like repeat-containing protein [candidate division KSB1 bacterium]